MNMQNTNQTIVENNSNGQRSGRKSLVILAAIGFILGGAIIFMYAFLSRNQVYVEKSLITADSIDLSAQNGGVLERIMVNVGDQVGADTPVAQVGQEVVKTREAGIITNITNDIGKNFSPNEPVVSMTALGDLRVVAQTGEDKGLSDIKVGQRAIFTVDAYGAKQYSGIVDQISPISRQQDVVFNISSQRQVNEFNVKIRFDENQYPELKNGMSAKAWIYKD